MGAISGLFGGAGGAAGTGFAGPTAAPLTATTNSGQLGSAYTGNQAALGSQQQLLQALQGQQGIQNQSQVYGQLQGVANGTGPNPAQAMLAQSTGQNVANQAALAAGQRGASANVGLMSRQAAQQGSAAQQSAAGQAATLQANQSLNALNSAGQIAGSQVQNQIGATSSNTQAQQAEQAALLQAQQAYNTTQAGQQANINTVNAGLAAPVQQGQQALIGGVANAVGMGGALTAGAGKAAPMAAGANGGVVLRFDTGGAVSSSMTDSPDQITADAAAGIGGTTSPVGGPQSSWGRFLANINNNRRAAGAGQNGANGAQTQMPQSGSAALQQGASSATSGLISALGSIGNSGTPAGARGGKVQALLSPGEKFLKPADIDKVKRGANPMKIGETIPGKPKVGGAKNSYANDTVPKKLDEGGIVIPRSVTQSDSPYRDAIRFVQATLAKKRSKA